MTRLTLDNLHLLCLSSTPAPVPSTTSAPASNDEGAQAPASARSAPAGQVYVLHGTNRHAWELIKSSGGLSRMKRQHIHLAAGRPGSGVISGESSVASQDVWPSSPCSTRREGKTVEPLTLLRTCSFPLFLRHEKFLGPHPSRGSGSRAIPRHTLLSSFQRCGPDARHRASRSNGHLAALIRLLGRADQGWERALEI